jgi:signal transduction histidine kinase/DNA-binding CsgD family transcriptional regulator
MLDVLDSSTTRFVQETERRRIARELHDGVVQSLSALVADLEYFQTRCLPIIDEAGHEVAEKVATWQELARDSLTSMRQALGELRNPAESDPDLEHAVQVMLNELRENGYRVVFECEAWPAGLSTEYTSNIYYIIREALANIRKHARASTIDICMFCFEKYLHVSVGDDGVGMAQVDVAANANSGYHQGLIGMRERATQLNGCLTIESLHSKGTRVDVEIPYFLEEQHAGKGQYNDGLTARELEVLVLIARGLLAKEISRVLAISEKTVRNHISSIYQKLNIFDRFQLVIYAMRNGLVDIHDGE